MSARSTRQPRRRSADDAHALGQRLRELDVLLVCGSGGVGKTSIAATIALDEAMRGRRVCVLTIDPAKRLAQAMGLDALDDRERKVKLPAGAAAGGSLHGLMLDAKTAFDRLVTESTSSDEERAQILDNRVYQQLSGSTSGMQEYMALERLYELDRGGKYDLVVVDTPPASHARELLDSPQRMLRFLEGRSLRWFLKPGAKVGRFGLKALGGSGGPVMAVLEKITGGQMLRDITQFFESMEGIYGQITDRIRVVERMFSSPRTGFLAVTSPERESVEQAVSFWELLEERNYRFVGTVVNRVEPAPPGRLVTPKELARIDGIADATGDALTISVPRLARLVSDLAGLRALAPYLAD
jgi:anion-transporting  ArsA/GET3 family ATPase